jgi:transcriptional regulator with XRE-family HTH domain
MKEGSKSMGQVVREAFAQWLRGQLRSNGWMVSDFADEVGVRPSAVYRWTAGQRTPTDGQIEKIATTLKVSPDVIWTELAREGITPMGTSASSKPPRATSTVSSDPPVPPADRPFARWLKGELDNRGWSAGYLARKIGLDVVTVRAWVGGLRTPASVQYPGLAEALGMDVEQIREAASK